MTKLTFTNLCNGDTICYDHFYFKKIRPFVKDLLITDNFYIDVYFFSGIILTLSYNATYKNFEEFIDCCMQTLYSLKTNCLILVDVCYSDR